jgi:hypothetical protein
MILSQARCPKGGSVCSNFSEVRWVNPVARPELLRLVKEGSHVTRRTTDEVL